MMSFMLAHRVRSCMAYGVPHAHLIVVPLHDSSDIVSAKYAYIEEVRVKYSEQLVPAAPRAELDRLAHVLA